MRTKFPQQKRHRNTAHLWADKQVVRFFRHNYPKIDYKNLRSIYLALCEVDSDFGEGKPINSFIKTVCTYSGMNRNVVNKYLVHLRDLRLIDYDQERTEDNGQFTRKSMLTLYKWEDTEEYTNSRCPHLRTSVKMDAIKNDKSSIIKNHVNMNKNTVLESLLSQLPEAWEKNHILNKAVRDYCKHREEKGNKLTNIACTKLARKLQKYSVETAIIALDRSVENGWTGVFPESVETKQHSGNNTRTNKAGVYATAGQHFKPGRLQSEFAKECIEKRRMSNG